MIELRLDRATAELMEKGGASITFPLRVNIHGDPATAVVCDDVSELTAYVLDRHDSPFSADVLTEYVRSFCEPLGTHRGGVKGWKGACFESVYL